MVSKKSEVVYSVKAFRLEFISLPIANQLQSNFYKLPCMEQRITGFIYFIQRLKINSFSNNSCVKEPHCLKNC